MSQWTKTYDETWKSTYVREKEEKKGVLGWILSLVGVLVAAALLYFFLPEYFLLGAVGGSLLVVVIMFVIKTGTAWTAVLPAWIILLLYSSLFPVLEPVKEFFLANYLFDLLAAYVLVFFAVGNLKKGFTSIAAFLVFRLISEVDVLLADPLSTGFGLLMVTVTMLIGGLILYWLFGRRKSVFKPLWLFFAMLAGFAYYHLLPVCMGAVKLGVPFMENLKAVGALAIGGLSAMPGNVCLGCVFCLVLAAVVRHTFFSEIEGGYNKRIAWRYVFLVVLPVAAFLAQPYLQTFAQTLFPDYAGYLGLGINAILLIVSFFLLTDQRKALFNVDGHLEKIKGALGVTYMDNWFQRGVQKKLAKLQAQYPQSNVTVAMRDVRRAEAVEAGFAGEHSEEPAVSVSEEVQGAPIGEEVDIPVPESPEVPLVEVDQDESLEALAGAGLKEYDTDFDEAFGAIPGLEDTAEPEAPSVDAEGVADGTVEAAADAESAAEEASEEEVLQYPRIISQRERVLRKVWFYSPVQLNSLTHVQNVPGRSELVLIVRNELNRVVASTDWSVSQIRDKNGNLLKAEAVLIHCPSSIGSLELGELHLSLDISDSAVSFDIFINGLTLEDGSFIDLSAHHCDSEINGPHPLPNEEFSLEFLQGFAKKNNMPEIQFVYTEDVADGIVYRFCPFCGTFERARWTTCPNCHNSLELQKKASYQSLALELSAENGD